MYGHKINEKIPTGPYDGKIGSQGFCGIPCKSSIARNAEFRNYSAAAEFRKPRIPSLFHKSWNFCKILKKKSSKTIIFSFSEKYILCTLYSQSISLIILYQNFVCSLRSQIRIQCPTCTNVIDAKNPIDVLLNSLYVQYPKKENIFFQQSKSLEFAEFRSCGIFAKLHIPRNSKKPFCKNLRYSLQENCTRQV